MPSRVVTNTAIRAEITFARLRILLARNILGAARGFRWFVGYVPIRAIFGHDRFITDDGLTSNVVWKSWVCAFSESWRLNVLTALTAQEFVADRNSGMSNALLSLRVFGRYKNR